MERELRRTDTEVIGACAGLRGLEPEWRALWRKMPRATPFQSPDWLIPWCRNLARGDPALLAIRRAGRLIALFPWITTGTAGATEPNIAFIGSGISDYQDAIIESGAERVAWQAVCAWLSQLPGRWTCRLECLPSFSPLRAMQPSPEWEDSTAVHDYCPVLKLGSGIGASVPAHQYANLRYYRGRARRLGALRIHQANEHTLGDCLADFFRLHALRWRETGNPGVLEDAAVARFHRDSAPALLRAGLLRLYVLRVGDRSAAALYGLSYRERFYYYLGGFDPEFHAISPGALLIGHAVEQATLEGATEFDFLRGREPYKYLWGARDQAVYRRELRPRRPAAGSADPSRIAAQT